MIDSALPEIDDELLALINVLVPYSQVFYLSPVGTFIIITNKANHGGIIQLDDAVALMPGHGVMGEQRIQQRAEGPAVWDTGVDDQHVFC